jgi:2-hydroxy-3-oxopropionate reductase
MARIAFIGLGVMGSPMAVNLVAAGHTVMGYNRTADRASALTAAGGTAATSIAEAVKDAEIVAVMVPDSPDVRDVVEGPDGVLAHAAAGALIIDFSSIRPDVSSELAELARSRGLSMIDAPVSGGEPGAIDGTLSIMVGATDEEFDRAKPILEPLAKTIVHVGAHGSGQTVKAANQLMVASNIQALAEAVVFLEAFDVDVAVALNALGGGLAGSAVLEQKAEKMRTRSLAPGFRIDLHHKDLGIVADSAREAGLALPAASLLNHLMASARACGDGSLDHSALIRGVERVSGLAADSGDS